MTSCMTPLLFILLVPALPNIAGFEVKVPDSPVTAVHGQYAVLSCSFPITRDASLDRIVITWQRAKSDVVIHSYYYERDQLEKQSQRYLNRTSLYYSELKNGNASLKLERVSPEDVGEYTCFVSNIMGSGQATLRLSFAAFFTQPVLMIKVQPQTMVFIFHSEGYPKPDVEWHSHEGDNISNLVETSYQESENSLYRVTSTLTVDLPSNKTYSFILRNKALDQIITNAFSLLPGEELENTDSQRKWWTLLLPLNFALLLVVVIMLCIRENRHLPSQNSFVKL